MVNSLPGGRQQTALTKYKIGLANTKDRTELVQKILDYVENIESGQFPSITKCALSCSISEKTLLSVELRSPDGSDIRVLLDIIRDKQKDALESGGLTKTFDPRFAAFLLKVHHNYREEPTTLTQNNTFNVSPELLAEAIEITRAKNPPKESNIYPSKLTVKKL